MPFTDRCVFTLRSGGDFVTRPESNQYKPYFETYIGKVPEGDIRETLSAQLDEFTDYIKDIGEDQATFRYSPEKWSVAEVIGHIIDCERIFGARALAIARSDETPLPSFDQDAYVANGNFNSRTLADLAEEFTSLRRSHLVLFGSFDEVGWERRGMAGGNEVTVKAIAWILAGHLIHHWLVLKDRYQRPKRQRPKRQGPEHR
jgi:hypothetical protein